MPLNVLTNRAGKKRSVAIPHAAIASLECEQKDQSSLFELGKDMVRPTLKLLEERSGKAITLQDADTCRQHRTPNECEGK